MAEDTKPTENGIWEKWLIRLILAVLAALTGINTCTHRDHDKKPPEPTPIQAQGWIDDQAGVIEAKAAMQTLDFDETPAGKAVANDDLKHAYLWQAVEKVTGKAAPINNQNPVGSCVSFGTGRAFEKSLAVQIMLGDRFEWNPVVEEVIYGGSRVEVGGGRIRGDGSIGAWAAKWVKDWGALPRGKHTVGGKTYDLTRYDPTLCRDWGYKGVPDDLEPEVKKYAAGDTAQITSWASAKKALSQGYGIAVSSNQGFTSRRDANGVCQPSGSWAHCMCLDGFHIAEDGKEYGHIENSWGENYHTGPTGWGNPTSAGFWTDSNTIDRMLRHGDSWAFAAVKGFPSRKIDWFAMAKPVNPKHQPRDVFLAQIWRSK